MRACAVEMHMDLSQEQFFAKICRETSGCQFRAPRFMRACAVEVHMDFSQEQFFAKICLEDVGDAEDVAI